YFLFESVAYGRYTVRMAKASAAALRLDPAFALSAVPGKQMPRVRLGMLALRPLAHALAGRDAAESGQGGARAPPDDARDGGG
ncbi:MAG: hypothetical protein F9K41_07500, partial [Sphingopyxis terrae]